MPPASLLRVDPLTGCLNLLAFTEWVGAYFTQSETAPVTILSLDVNRFSDINSDRGATKGDAVLHWVGIVLREISQVPVYRTGGDEFTIVIQKDSAYQANPLIEPATLADLIFTRLSQDAAQIGLQRPPATLSVIHFSANSAIHPEEALLMVGAAILLTKQRLQRSFHEFNAVDLQSEIDHISMRWFAGRMIENIVLLGRKLDETEHLAYTDPVTGMPNQRAAAQILETALENAVSEHTTLAVLMIDGDDLKAYNEISYAAGDEMICRLANTLHSNLRPGDFLARWRVGDEFLVILPATDLEHGVIIGERLVAAIRDVSQGWQIPISISAGLAFYPGHGSTAQALLDAAERANMQAKTAGKDRIVIA